MPLFLPFIALVCGFALLIWSADRFVDGAAATARHAGMPLLLVGMVVVGFGTSAPELLISAIASTQGNPGLALGNAFGSNISNIALILGIAALISPVPVSKKILRTELPVLMSITIATVVLLINFSISRFDAILLLLLFAAVMVWWIVAGLRQQGTEKLLEASEQQHSSLMSLKTAVVWLMTGLVLLVLSSRLLVWGAVEIASAMGISDLVIGLTIVAIGTSLPELASAVAAARKRVPELVLGNVIGSNIFNTLAVVGIAGIIHPLDIGAEVLYRDCLVMTVLTLALFIPALGGRYRISRLFGVSFLLVYLAYMLLLALQAFGYL
ncbi:MAG: calcium/sodium antiporter [Pelovirga sp.]